MLRTVLQIRPPHATHWTVRGVASQTGISKSTVQRDFTLFGGAAASDPRASSSLLTRSSWKRSATSWGSISIPPTTPWCFASTRRARIQALERTQPNLPLGLGCVEGVTHDYTRHGTTTLFAALDIKTGEVFAQCKRHHRHQEFLAFLREGDANVPAPLTVHLILDNYGTHKHRKVKAWLARHPRFQLHFTPTYASWLNQVERWFALITQRAIRRGWDSGVTSRWCDSPQKSPH